MPIKNVHGSQERRQVDVRRDGHKFLFQTTWNCSNGGEGEKKIVNYKKIKKNVWQVFEEKKRRADVYKQPVSPFSLRFGFQVCNR